MRSAWSSGLELPAADHVRRLPGYRDPGSLFSFLADARIAPAAWPDLHLSYRALTPIAWVRRRFRSSEFWFIGLAIAVGAASGLATVALGSIARGIQHLLFGLPDEQRLSMMASLSPVQLAMLPLGGVVLAVFSWAVRARKRTAGRRGRGECAARRTDVDDRQPDHRRARPRSPTGSARRSGSRRAMPSWAVRRGRRSGSGSARGARTCASWSARARGRRSPRRSARRWRAPSTRSRS